MLSHVLSPDAIEQFIRDGYVHVPAVMPPSTVNAIVDRLWEVLAAEHAVRRNEPATWRQPVVHLQKSYGGPPFVDGWTPRLWGAIDDLVGSGSYQPRTTMGWWPVAFPGFESKPWAAPDDGWHIDGIDFHHHLDSANQGLLGILILSDIEPGDGGTVFVPGSHRITARILAEAEPEGLDCDTLSRRVIAATPRTHVVEANGAAGDAILLHPFMLHSRSPNTGSRVRFICNPCISLNASMTLDPDAPGRRTPVEQAIINALK